MADRSFPAPLIRPFAGEIPGRSTSGSPAIPPLESGARGPAGPDSFHAEWGTVPISESRAARDIQHRREGRKVLNPNAATKEQRP
jgi:hypothetical protein